MTIIYELDNDGKIKEKAIYSIAPKKALICYIEQKKGNYNDFNYPDTIEGIRQSKMKAGHYYYDDGNIVIVAYPYKKEV